MDKRDKQIDTQDQILSFIGWHPVPGQYSTPNKQVLYISSITINLVHNYNKHSNQYYIQVLL